MILLQVRRKMNMKIEIKNTMYHKIVKLPMKSETMKLVNDINKKE